MVSKKSSTGWYMFGNKRTIHLLTLILVSHYIPSVLGGTCTPCPGAPTPPVSIFTLATDIYATQCIGTLIKQLPFTITVPGLYTLCSDLTFAGPGAAITIATGTLVDPTLINFACHRLTSGGDGIRSTPGLEGPFSVFNGVLELTGAGLILEGFIQSVDNMQLIGGGTTTGAILPTQSTFDDGLTLRISNSEIRQVGFALDLAIAGIFNQEIEIINCRFDASQSLVGGAFMILDASNVVIRDSVFSGGQGSLMSSTFNKTAIYNTNFQDAVIVDPVNPVSYFDWATNFQIYDCTFSNIQLNSPTSNLLFFNNCVGSLYNVVFQNIILSSSLGTNVLINATDNSLLDLQNCTISDITINNGPASIFNTVSNPFPSGIDIWDTVFGNIFLTSNSQIINISVGSSFSLHRCAFNNANTNVAAVGVSGILATNGILSMENTVFSSSIFDCITSLVDIQLDVANSRFIGITGNGINVTTTPVSGVVIRSSEFNTISGSGIIAAGTGSIVAQSNIFNNIPGTGINVGAGLTQQIYNNVTNLVTTPYTGVTGPIGIASLITTTTTFYTNIAG